MLFETILFIAVIATGTIGLVEKFYSSRQKLLFKKKTVVGDYARSLFPVLLLVFCLRSFAFEAFRIPSASMKPTLVEGDFILVDKYSHGVRLPITGQKVLATGEPRRGDVVVFRGKVHGKTSGVIKRIVGLPGDKIRYSNKSLFINGKLAAQTFVESDTDLDYRGTPYKVARKTENLDEMTHDIFITPSEDRALYQFNDTTVPKDSYFVMGDNRDNSNDSRFWGFLSDQQIIGKARYVWFNYKWPTEFHLNRIGKIG